MKPRATCPLLSAIPLLLAAQCGTPDPVDNRADEERRDARVVLARGRVALVGRESAVELLEAGEPVNVRREFNKDGGRGWEKTLFALDDFFFVHNRRRSCGRVHGDSVREQGKTTTKCNIEMDMVLERESGQKCRITAVVVAPAGGEGNEFCWPYAQCLAEARTGERIPCPPPVEDSDADTHVLIRLYLQALHQPKLFREEFVSRLISDHERVRKQRTAPAKNEDYRRAYLRTMADRYLEYLRWHHQQLVNEAG